MGKSLFILKHSLRHDSHQRVTNASFGQFVAQTGYHTTAETVGAAWGYDNGVFRNIAGPSWKSFDSPERADHPVVPVSWHDAVAYCGW